MSALAAIRRSSLVRILGEGDSKTGERRLEVATHYWGRGMTPREISELMGITRNQVDSDVRMARKILPPLRRTPGGGGQGRRVKED